MMLFRCAKLSERMSLMLMLAAFLFFPGCEESEPVDHAAKGREYGETLAIPRRIWYIGIV